MQRQMAQDRHRVCALALAQATVVFPHAALEPPLERLFHAPGLADGWGATDGLTGPRGQEQARLARDRPTHCAVGLDQANPGTRGPRALHASALASRCAPRVAGVPAARIG